MHKCPILIVAVLLSYFSFAQVSAPLSDYDMTGIRSLVTKEDFNNLQRVLQMNGFKIEKANYNYNDGNYQIHCDIIVSRIRGKFLPKPDNSPIPASPRDCEEEISVTYREAKDYKELFFSHRFVQSTPYDFFKYKYNWVELPWTVVRYGNSDYNKIKIGKDDFQPKDIPCETVKAIQEYDNYDFDYRAKSGLLERSYHLSRMRLDVKDAFYIMPENTYSVLVSMIDVYPKKSNNLNSSKTKN